MNTNVMDDYFHYVNTYDWGKKEFVRTCQLCDHTIDLTYRFKYEHLYECPKCSFTWLAHQPKLSKLNKFYEESEAMKIWADEVKGSGFDDERQDTKFSFFWEFIKKNNIKSVMDVGCGTGHFLNNLPDGAQGIGLDPNIDSVRHCNVPVIKDLSQIKQKFDMITMFGLLEHLKHPSEVVSSYTTLVNDYGYFGIIVPNIDSLAFSILQEGNCTICPQHLWYFNIHTLTKFMNDLNFDLITFKTVESEYQPICRKLKGIHPYNKIGGLELSINDFDADKILRTNQGAKICAVYQKKHDHEARSIADGTETYCDNPS